MYPITNKLKQDAAEAGIDISRAPYVMMIGAVEAYEHGNAETADLFMGIDAAWADAAEREGLRDDDLEDQQLHEMLMAYAAVTLDLMLTIYAQS